MSTPRPFTVDETVRINLNNWSGKEGTVEIDTELLAFRVVRDGGTPGDIFWLLVRSHDEAVEGFPGFTSLGICPLGKGTDDRIGVVVSFTDDAEWEARGCGVGRTHENPIIAAAELVVMIY